MSESSPPPRQPGEPIDLTIILHDRSRAELQDIVVQCSDPTSDAFGHHLTRAELVELVALHGAQVDAVHKWLERAGMVTLPSGPVGGQLVAVRATEEQIKRAFGRHLANWLGEPAGHRSPRVDTAVPRDLAGYIQAVHGLRNAPEARSSMVARAREEQVPDELREGFPYSVRSELGKPPPGLGGVTPSDIRRIYSFPDGLTGRGETIALLMLGGSIDIGDLQLFWRAHGIPAPEVKIVDLGPTRGRLVDPLHRLEATMTVAWAGAMAPGAKIVVYFVDPEVVADPWAMFLLAVIGDVENDVTVASTSWIIPERRYYRIFGSSVVSGLLDQAASLGITVISAAGDWGALDGIPRRMVDGYAVSDAPWPHGVFPAVEERVLGVGGTMITCLDPLTELAWSGPPPVAVAKAVQFTQLASSGGFSQDVPIPDWQQPTLRKWYARGANTPAVVPYGRGFPDVALMASGPAVQRGDVLSALGYQAVIGRNWIDYAGGTSMAAPIWASIIALVNEARRAAGKGRVGFANPALYSLRKAMPSPFRDITIGQTDVCVRVVNSHGKAVVQRVDGYSAGQDWDPVTGLGVPHVANLVRHLVELGTPRTGR
jgi:kumamolisin